MKKNAKNAPKGTGKRSLSLNKQTIRVLTAARELAAVRGAAPSEEVTGHVAKPGG